MRALLAALFSLLALAAPLSAAEVSSPDGRIVVQLDVDNEGKAFYRVDRDGEPLEQYRAVSYVINPKVADVLKSLKNVELPAVVQLPPQPQADLNWKVSWLPRGFESVSRNRHRLMMTDRPVESKMFSDGLFSFSIYISAADNFTVREQLVRQGRRTLHSYLIKDKEVTVVGDIPPATARRVAESVVFAHGGSNEQ